jgi:hypothetical protein
MPSLVAWLDASTEEQRRMREILRLFSDHDSRDELGLGQLRDGLSDALFPGTSTLLTRARYLLFVPWCLQLAAEHSDPVREADRAEHLLIAAIKDTSDTAGLLGMRAGSALRNLPSGIYWTMLRHYRILRDPELSRADAVRLPRLARGLDDLDGGASVHVWAQLPPAPEGFPRVVPGGFDLRPEEAAWIRERLLDGAPDTLLAHLLFDPPQRDSTAPWRDPAALAVDGRSRDLLHHAQTFSVVMHGAQLLYNLLLAESHESFAIDASTHAAGYRASLERWAESVSHELDLPAWDLTGMLRAVELQRGSPIHPGSRRFVEQWTALLRRRDPAALATDDEARRFIRAREKTHKGPQARIGNAARLRDWRGSSGAGEMTFRWTTVRGILSDLHDGLGR